MGLVLYENQRRFELGMKCFTLHHPNLQWVLAFQGGEFLLWAINCAGSEFKAQERSGPGRNRNDRLTRSSLAGKYSSHHAECLPR
jgi:hypothetical protein